MREMDAPDKTCFEVMKHMTKVTPTRDLALARQQLAEFGYCLIANALNADEVAELRQRITEQAAGEQQHGIGFFDGGYGQSDLDEQGRYRNDRGQVAAENQRGVNQRVFFLVGKGECFRQLVTHPLTEQLVSEQLGDEFILSTFTANIAKKGGARMGLHTDQWWMPQPTYAGMNQHRRVSTISRLPAPEFLQPDLQLGIAPPVVTSALWMLTDFSRQNGATELVPASHLSGAYPDEANPQLKDLIIQAEAPAGTLMVFDGRIWHGTGANVAGPDRIGLIACYCAPQFRQQENIPLGLAPQVWQSLSPTLRRRLGYKVWNAYGRIESDFGGFVEPGQHSVGELGHNV